jgi:hypothetical protein
MTTKTATAGRESRPGPEPRWTARVISHLEPKQLEAMRERAVENGHSVSAEIRVAVARHLAQTPEGRRTNGGISESEAG